MATFEVTGVINLEQVESIDPSQTFKVAVTRHCRPIQSVVVKTQRNERQIPWRIAFDIDRKSPTGVNVVVGPDIPDDRLRSVQTHQMRIPARAFKEGAAKAELAISDRLYRTWLGFCRTYTIRGRMVCRKWRWDPIEQQLVPCESPVRGALVTAYDVDRIWWWCRTDAVGSDYTDLNGNFEITFRWCCWWWGPWYFKDWRLDPAVVRRIRSLSETASPTLPLPPPSPEVDFKIFERIVSEADALQVDTPLGESALGNAEHFIDAGRKLAARLPAAADLREMRIWPWWPRWDCQPDIIFKAVQDCGDGDVVIYNEGCSDARWNIPTELSGVTLVANEEACCAPCCTQPPDDDCLVFQGVGCGAYPTTQIEQSPASDLAGYGYPGSMDRPFGRTIRLLGVFGDSSTVDFYKVQSRRYDKASSTWTSWADIPTDQLRNFNRLHWLGFPPPLQLKQVVATELVDGEMVIKTTRRFREEHTEIDDAVDPTNDDWLALWVTATVATDSITGNLVETPLIPDGLYDLRLVGYDYDADGGVLTNQRIMPLCPGEEGQLDPAVHATMLLRIDNRDSVRAPGTVHFDTLEPASDYPNICAVVKNEGTATEECVSVCGVVSVVAGDTLTVHFRASDEDGHLERYTLNAHWAESDVFNMLRDAIGSTISPDPDPLFGPRYSDTFDGGGQGVYRGTLPVTEPEHDRPFWYGGQFKATVTVGAPVPSTSHHFFETCCAYLLRLKVWKRTTNGCAASRHFHVNYSEFSFTVVRADLPCAEGLLGTSEAAES